GGGVHVEGGGARGLEVDDQREFVWRLHRQVCRLLAAQYAIDIRRGAPPQIGRIDTERNQPAVDGVSAERVNRGNAVTGGKADDQIAMDQGDRAGWQDQPTIRLARELLERTLGPRRGFP